MPNRLAQAQSLYLRKHADNPIDWWEWSDAALATARQQDQPIFLSIGYSSCHWCTVMEGEAFSDLAIAEYMNANFLPIKVDREERPDLDSIYMQALQMMIRQGGWPLNIFLAPDDLIPFYGGTYFPIEPRYGQPGFLQTLQAIRTYYDTQKAKLQEVKHQISVNLQEITQLQTGSLLSSNLLRQGLEYNTGVISGTTSGPSFPMIPYAEVAQRTARFAFESRYDAAAASRQRGLSLALGGIFDHVAGGFHRYTVDPTWTVPHFEKMLYDNGQITEYLANLWAAGVQEPAFERAIALTVQWLKREMRSPGGYFYAAQDADNFVDASAKEPEEGAFYVWSYAALSSLLSPPELDELAQNFTISEKGNFEGQNVLQRRQPGNLSETAEAALDKLFQVRYGAFAAEVTTFLPAQNNQAAKTNAWAGRIPPVTDTKMIVAWNSLMISGLAQAAVVFQQAEYLDLAADAALFILNHQWQNGRLHRVNYGTISDHLPVSSSALPSYQGVPSVLAQSEDYALLIKALIDIYQASLGFAHVSSSTDGESGDRTSEQVTMHTAPEFWLEQAIRVQTEFDEYLWSIELKGYYNTDAGSDLLIRERSYIDNATPAANGVAATNLVRLSLLTEDLEYLDKAEQTLQSFATVMEKTPQACPSLFSALDWFYYQTLVRTSAEQIAKFAPQYLPTTVYKVLAALPEGAIALVCQGLSCNEPARTYEQLTQQIQASQTRAGF